MSDAFEPESRIALGIDIGGTKIAAGLVDVSTGEIMVQDRAPTAYERGAGPILDDTKSLSTKLLGVASDRGLSVRGIGLGICEIVDQQGKITSHALADWQSVSFDDVANRLPINLVSDVRAAALAELRFGAARGVSHALYISIGSGISSCIIMDGKPYAGAHGAALVLASARAPSSSLSCGEANATSLEDIASGFGIERTYDPRRRFDARTILARAQEGDARARAIVDAAARSAGEAIGTLSNCTDPELIVIGGGLGTAGGLYLASLTEAIGRARWSGMMGQMRIEPAALGADAGLVGAAIALQEALH